MPDAKQFHFGYKKTEILRWYSENGGLNEDNIHRILIGELGQKPKPNRTPVVKINKTIYARYFTPDQPPTEIEEIIEKALELYFGTDKVSVQTRSQNC